MTWTGRRYTWGGVAGTWNTFGVYRLHILTEESANDESNRVTSVTDLNIPPLEIIHKKYRNTGSSNTGGEKPSVADQPVRPSSNNEWMNISLRWSVG